MSEGQKSRLDDLLVVLDRLEALHRDLCDSLAEKLEHMRRSDQEGIHRCTDREQLIATRLTEQEGLRKQLMAKIGRGYGLSPKAARALSANQLAERLAEPHSGAVAERAQRLRSTLEQVNRINRLVERVSREILDHLSEAFTAIATDEQPQSGYSQGGRAHGGRPRELFEAVG
jgi:hypothetical protein